MRSLDGGWQMNEAIATIHERMQEGGDWKAFQEEIAALHDEAATEEEYVTLMEAHRNLVAVGRYAFDEDTYAKLLPVTQAEYRLFLNKEAMEGDHINPAKLDRITKREVDAGRLDTDDSFRMLAADAGAVLGDLSPILAHSCKRGDWFLYGVASAAVAAAALERTGASSLWLIAPAILIGWYINERQRRAQLTAAA